MRRVGTRNFTVVSEFVFFYERFPQGSLEFFVVVFSILLLEFLYKSE